MMEVNDEAIRSKTGFINTQDHESMGPRWPGTITAGGK
ncbi:MAG: hypothetical protein H6Q41_2954, partial [Deltaproteobacteria bacterium]|nr:hypothetical protein [Deltaproteobacteria bacterium]